MVNPVIDQQGDAPSAAGPHHGPEAMIPQPPDLGTPPQNLSHDDSTDVVDNPEDDAETEVDIGQEVLDLLSLDDDEASLLENNDELGFAENAIVQARTLVPPPEHELVIGQEFPDVKSCRRALRDMAMALHFEMKTVKSDQDRFTARCASEGCPWRVHASKLPGVPTFAIRTMSSEHTCQGIAHLGHCQASVQWVADLVERQIRENPRLKPKDLVAEIHRTHGIALPYKQAWRGRERAMAALRASFEEDYRLLPQYCDQIKQRNPESVALVSVNPFDSTFQRLFVSYRASLSGFRSACRPLIGLERTVLKNLYAGSMLYATGFDAEGELFPLAFCVVEEEDGESWRWFVAELSKLVHGVPGLTIVSDRRQVIVDAVDQHIPRAFHGLYVRGLIESFKKDFNDHAAMANLIGDAAKAPTVAEFDEKMLELEAISQDAGDWVRRVPTHLWADSHSEGARRGLIDVDVSEAMNSWMVLEASALPIVQMMEQIRGKLMVCFNERREAGREWAEGAMFLVPSAQKRLVEAMDLAKGYMVRAREGVYEVGCGERDSYAVDVGSRSCTCGGWRLNGIPCPHAAAAISFCRHNAFEFVESYFTVSAYRLGYSETIRPILDRTQWQASGAEDGDGVDVVVNPPKSLRPLAAQPRKRRARNNVDDNNQPKRVVHCSRCNQAGHFRTTCTAPL